MKYLPILLLVACGATPIQREAYHTEAMRCLMNEDEIVRREGTTLEQDLADLEIEQARCDAALEAIYPRGE